MNIGNAFTRIGSKAIKKLSETSPTLLVVGGIGCGVAATVMACKETVKAKPVIDESKKYLTAIDEAHKAGSTAYGESYSNKDYAKDLFIQYVHTGRDLAKVYWPAITLGTVSIAMILAGHHIINKRYVAAVGAYKALSDTFTDYRKRVADKIGVDAEKNLRYNIKEEIKHEADPENGVTSEEKVRTVDPNSYINGTERYFHGDIYDENGNLVEKGIDGFDGSLNGNIMNARFLEVKENYLNQKLAAQGYLTLNQAYEELGFAPTEEGQLIGWRWDPKQEHKISLGIDNLLNPAVKQFQLGESETILLTFNCDAEPLVSFRKSHKERSNKKLSGGNVPTKEVFC